MVLWLLIFNLLQVALISCASQDVSVAPRQLTAIERGLIPEGLNKREALVWAAEQMRIMLKMRQIEAKNVTDILRPYINYAATDPQKNEYFANGQTVAHALSTLHWVPGLLKTMHQRRFNSFPPTIYPDFYIGSTPAHIIAGMLVAIAKTDGTDSPRFKNGISALVYLYQIDPRKNMVDKEGNGLCHFYSQSGTQQSTVFDILNRAGYDPSKDQCDQRTGRDIFIEKINLSVEKRRSSDQRPF